MLNRKLIAAGLLASTLLPCAAWAEDPPSPHTVTGNLTFVTDYRFRGISQTMRGPAVQGGFDYAHSSGIYLGTWGSNVSGTQFVDGNMEWDFYGGYNWKAGDFYVGPGLLYYYYYGAQIPLANGKRYNTGELYVQGGWKWISGKVSYTLTDYFGIDNAAEGGATPCNFQTATCDADNGNSKGSLYYEMNLSYPILEKLSLVAHLGHQKVHNYNNLDYTDWKVGVTYDLSGWILGAAYVDTNAKEAYYTLAKASGGSKELGKQTLVLSVGRTF